MSWRMTYHDPVLLFESVDGLKIKPAGIYVDVTFGGGGHSREILKRLGPEGQLFAFDQDEEAQANAISDDRFTLIPHNFRFLKKFLRFSGVKEVDGILADLGVSSHQFDQGYRGFSIRFDGPLDMRMNQENTLTAAQVIQTYSEEELADVLFQYGELRNSRPIAREIVKQRAQGEIATSFALKAALERFLIRGKESKVLAKVFQALRIEVNQEMEVLKEFLLQSSEMLSLEGRLSIISYHSLEDRLVKNYMAKGVFSGEPEKDFYGNASLPLKKVGKLILPSPEEIKKNNRARSAKLRVAQKI